MMFATNTDITMEAQEAILRDFFPDGYTIVNEDYVAVYPGSMYGMYGDILCKCIGYNMSTGPFIASCMNNHADPGDYYIMFGLDHIKVIVLDYYRNIIDAVTHKHQRGLQIKRGKKLINHFPVNIMRVPKPRLKINRAYHDITIKTFDDEY